ncbi:hypothetical protein ACLOJK_012076 [Asimina triloba]
MKRYLDTCTAMLPGYIRIRGDQQHFVRRDELKAAWEIFTPLLHRIDDGELKALPYKPGSRGPAEADELLSKAGYVQTHGYLWVPPSLRDGLIINAASAIRAVGRSEASNEMDLDAESFFCINVDK